MTTPSDAREVPHDASTEAPGRLGPRCLDCGYVLRGLPENRCPECGRHFDPDDPRTMNMGRVVRPGVRWLLKPPGKVFAAILGCTCLLALVSCAVPGHYIGFFLISYLVGMLIAIFWLVRLVVAVALALYYRQPAFKHGTTCIRWATTPVLIALMVLLMFADVPLQVTYWLSRPAMDRLARNVMSSTADQRSTDWVGLYHATDIQPIPGGMRFVINGAGLFDRAGFAYSPERPLPDIRGEDYYTPLSDGWYVWIESW